jgi:hypothetical protein
METKIIVNNYSETDSESDNESENEVFEISPKNKNFSQKILARNITTSPNLKFETSEGKLKTDASPKGSRTSNSDPDNSPVPTANVLAVGSTTTPPSPTVAGGGVPIVPKINYVDQIQYVDSSDLPVPEMLLWSCVGFFGALLLTLMFFYAVKFTRKRMNLPPLTFFSVENLNEETVEKYEVKNRESRRLVRRVRKGNS